MSVREISREEFDKYSPARGPDIGTLILEKAWYANADNTLIGVITFDVPDRDWGYAVLGRDERGRFRAIDNDVSRPSLEDAKTALIAAITAAESSGQSTFSQGDE